MYHYKISFHDEDSEDGRILTEEGIVGGGNAGEAINRLINWYGEKQVVMLDNFYELCEVLTIEELKDF